MVCVDEEEPVETTVRDTSVIGARKTANILLKPSTIIASIFKQVGDAFNYNPDGVEPELVLQENSSGKVFVLNDHKDKTLHEVGVQVSPNIRNTIVISTLRIKNVSQSLSEVNNEDDLLLGASASPTTSEMATSTMTTGPEIVLSDRQYLPYSVSESADKESGYSRRHRYTMKSSPVEPITYVGLVNQAMTCYLNSLLQTLFMTPEFRNALYKWEFDGINDTRSIPFQLQRLFLNLQTSNKSSIETTDLTTSFGWQGSEAWHQHDIQELCRVMFDALERKFKDTEQANLINDLYEGKMLDYVKCLECGTEKSREDTFLDIPLPVRPFGSTVAYNSVEEALRAFVQPETLDGNNQYHCEKCNKKCDAHKGLKFIKFPYLLTLHLKRFDFDYNTMHRIKLNDKVVFPERLNLNSFIPNSRTENDTIEERDIIVKCDDCSTTDSGSALDDESCQGTDVSSTVNGQDDNCEDSDEGIDVSSGNNHTEVELNGPFIYELFSIMIHSGSASGGHYYAYIKDFDKNQWFCFNDQSVTRITDDDIKKSYGGGPQRGYYSAYSSSTNAYMLMYRQIDKERNCNAMSVEQFPEHIQKLLQQMRYKEEQDRINREKENNMIKFSVYCYHPTQERLKDVSWSLALDSTLADAACFAHKRFKLDGIVNLEDCRIVTYNKKHDCIDYSFDSDDLKFCDIANRVSLMHNINWMLEIKEPGTEFMVYKESGINMKLFPINWDTEEVEEPALIRVDIEDTVRDLKKKVAKLLNMNVNNVELIQVAYGNEPEYLYNDDDFVKVDMDCTDHKLFVSNGFDDPQDRNLIETKVQKIIEKFGYIISINVVLPETDVGTLEMLSIPSLEFQQTFDKLEVAVDQGTNSPTMRVSPQPVTMCGGDCFGDQSNSEDSSLSDSDRTLVGDAPGECTALGCALVSSTLNSPANQHMTSPMDPAEDCYNYDVLGNPAEEMHWDAEETNDDTKCVNYYFKVASVVECGTNTEANYSKYCHILADKRMTLELFKKYLEPVVKVPVEFFKVFRQFQNMSDDEWNTLTDTLRSMKGVERLVIKLGRVLSKNEYSCKVYSLKPENPEPAHYLFEHIIAKGQTVGQAKKEILLQIKKQHMVDIPYNKCRLREKSWKRPRHVYLDDQKFVDDISVSASFELYIQELNEVEKVVSTNQLVLFVRHWCPSTLTLQPLQEIVLDGSTMEELKRRISEISNIPFENVEVAHVKTAFPADMHLLDIHTEIEWKANVTHLEQWPVQADQGSTFLYRDNREALKDLTQDERKEINQKENNRLGRYTMKNYSPGRERALKIYLDASPSKSEDDCID